MPESTKATPTLSFFGEATLLASLTGLAYAFAYAFEAGVADYFGYPYWVIDLTLSSVLLALGSILVTVGIVAALGFNLLLSASALDLAAVKIILRTFRRSIGALILLMGITWVIFSFPPAHWRVAAALYTTIALSASFFIALDLGYILRMTRLHRGELPYVTFWSSLADIRQQHDRADVEESFVPHTLGGTVVRSLWTAVPLTLGLLCVPFAMILACVTGVGALVASRQQTFLVSAAAPTEVVLRRYNDYLVLAAFDSATNTIRARYRLLSLSEASQLQWQVRRLPKATVEDPTTGDEQPGT